MASLCHCGCATAAVPLRLCHCGCATAAVQGASMLESAIIFRCAAPMIETNPIRQRIAELVARLDALRGYL